MSTLGLEDRRDEDGDVKNMQAVGIVVEQVVDSKQVACRVQLPDRNNLITKPLPVLQRSAGGMRTFSVPKVGQRVKISRFGNGLEHGSIDGTYFTPGNPPPTVNPNMEMAHFSDGSMIFYDPGANTMKLDMKGPVDLETLGPITLVTTADTTIRAANILIEAGTIVLRGETTIDGPLTVIGDIEHTGNMNTSGVHQDSNGFHV